MRTVVDEYEKQVVALHMTPTFIERIHKMPAHTRMWIAVFFALVTFTISGKTPPAIQFILVWSSFAFFSLVLFWITIWTAEIHEVKYIAKKQDSSRTIIFFFVLFAAIISLFAVIILLKILPDTKQAGYRFHVGFSIVSVILSWMLIHTVFTFRYAHLYYTCRTEESDMSKENEGGLQFPGDSSPDYLDFAYFAFVIGMTFQVSDVEISSRQIRHLALFHGLISFVYNTVILALSVTIIAGLVQK
jgi:uncharacterized membrane protein